MDGSVCVHCIRGILFYFYFYIYFYLRNSSWRSLAALIAAGCEKYVANYLLQTHALYILKLLKEILSETSKLKTDFLSFLSKVFHIVPNVVLTSLKRFVDIFRLYLSTHKKKRSSEMLPVDVLSKSNRRYASSISFDKNVKLSN